MERTKDAPEVAAAWRHMVACARAFVRCADEFGDDIGATADHHDALERAQERLARAWDGEPVESARGIRGLTAAAATAPGTRVISRSGAVLHVEEHVRAPAERAAFDLGRDTLRGRP